MIGHLGARASALLDGQLPPAEAEEAWAHVYTCHACRDLVEREGWVKTRLAGLCGDAGAAPADLKGSLLSLTPGERYLTEPPSRAGARRSLGVAVLGGGAIGATFVGVLALGVLPGSDADGDRRPPPARVESPSATAGGDTPTSPRPALVSTPSAPSSAPPSAPSTAPSSGVEVPVAGHDMPAWIHHPIG